MTKDQATQILRHLADVVLEATKEAGAEGAPEGPMYVAFMSYGVSLEMFTRIVDALIAVGKLRLSGHVLYAVAK